MNNKQHCPHHVADCTCLAAVIEDQTAIIIQNKDHKTMERGLYHGVEIRVLRNEPNEPNIIVAVGDARYVLDKKIAAKIRVKPI